MVTDSPCEFDDHNRGYWDENKQSVYWCPDCRTEMWVDTAGR
jgi:hypothetical protein